MNAMILQKSFRKKKNYINGINLVHKVIKLYNNLSNTPHSCGSQQVGRWL